MDAVLEVCVDSTASALAERIGWSCVRIWLSAAQRRVWRCCVR